MADLSVWRHADFENTIAQVAIVHNEYVKAKAGDHKHSYVQYRKYGKQHNTQHYNM